MEPWKRNLYSLWTTEFLAVLGMSLVLPFLPFYIRELGVKELEEVKRWSGLIYAAPFLLATFTGPSLGLAGRSLWPADHAHPGRFSVLR